jgi:hypothetical protein
MSERMADERLADYEFVDDGCKLLACFKAERAALRDTLTEIAEVACMPFPDLATKDEVVAKVVGLEAELTKLKAFALWALAGYRGDELGDIDGGDLQDKAEALGLLVGVTVTEPCGEGCNCMDWDDFPQTCYRIPEWLKEQS